MKSRIVAVAIALFLVLLPTPKAHAANPINDLSGDTPLNQLKYFAGPTKSPTTPCDISFPEDPNAGTYGAFNSFIGAGAKAFMGLKDPCGNTLSSGLVPQTATFIADLYKIQPSGQEYVADLLNNIGIPSVSRAYAQGTGYKAMQPFLPFWKAFRNLAYSLYIVMFVVVGIMIMLRTKINAQTVITIQAAIPNLLITLILITFSYAIVGFLIDIMYFLIYFLVFLMGPGGAGIINDPNKLITRLMSYSAWSVIFAGRNSIISAIASSIDGVLSGIGTGGLQVIGKFISFVSPTYLIVAVAFAIAMLKLMFALVKAYVMLIVQTITAPVQILMNAMPGSKAFGEWLKKTASYIIPFPVAAAMFIFSAILVGNPTDKTILKDIDPNDANPFGVDQSHELYQNASQVWLPPFTLTGTDITNQDVLTLIGFFVFTMTPAAVKMAQDWLQVKESPYSAEAFSNISMGVKGGMIPPNFAWHSFQEELAAQRSAKALSGVINANPKGDPAQPRPK